YNPQNSASVKLTGWSDGTRYELIDLDDGTTVVSGTLDRYQTRNIPMSGVRNFKLAASTPLHATLGYDCCNFGGSLYYPTLDGRTLVGREFILRIPVLTGSNIFAIFAFEEATVTVRDSAGNVVLTREMTAGSRYATSGSPLARNVVYHVTATGDIALQSSSRNAHSAVPARNGTDVGSEFMFHAFAWSQTGMAVFAYEDADFQLTRIDDGAAIASGSLVAGDWTYLAIPTQYYRLTSSGRVGLWAGSTEGGSGISWLGDDLTQNTGDGGRELLIHSQTQGARIFALLDGTQVTIDGETTTLNADESLALGGNRFYRIVANKPVVVQTIGGNGLNDWETELKLVP
ncbi:MAG: hypothetical protein R3310_03825, partial [Candidatus Competibacteraceae bacterium]|nr:hypothetical protein [Candidatus Competibacteraceae bacterium]